MRGGRGTRACRRDRRKRLAGSGSRSHRSRDARRARRRPRRQRSPLPACPRLRAGGGGRPADDPRARQPRVVTWRRARTWRRSRSSTWRFASQTSRDSRRSAAWRSRTAARPSAGSAASTRRWRTSRQQDLYRRLGSRLVAYPLANLGHVYRWRGQWALARVAYEEAIANAEASGDLQGLVPALSGLARVVVGDDVAEASRLVDRALEVTHGMHSVHVLVSAGLVALVRGDRVRASAYALESASRARARRDLGGLAESLEVATLAAPRPALELDRLDEAIAISATSATPSARRGRSSSARSSRATRRRASGSRSGCGRWAPVDTGRRSPCSFPSRPRMRSSSSRSAGSGCSAAGAPSPSRPGSPARPATCSRSWSPGAAGRCHATR